MYHDCRYSGKKDIRVSPLYGVERSDSGVIHEIFLGCELVIFLELAVD